MSGPPGLPSSSGLDGPNKINAAYNNGPVPLVQTIEDTFGIPISHFVVVDFIGLINAIQSVNGINMRFNYPVRDNARNGRPCSERKPDAGFKKDAARPAARP